VAGERAFQADDLLPEFVLHNPLPIPVLMQGRDCQDQVGCPELFNGDQVKLATLDQMGEVTIYRVRDISR
jgi:hypothetical protein